MATTMNQKRNNCTSKIKTSCVYFRHKAYIIASTVHDFNESMRYNSNTVTDTDLNYSTIASCLGNLCVCVCVCVCVRVCVCALPSPLTGGGCVTVYRQQKGRSVWLL